MAYFCGHKANPRGHHGHWPRCLGLCLALHIVGCQSGATMVLSSLMSTVRLLVGPPPHLNLLQSYTHDQLTTFRFRRVFLPIPCPLISNLLLYLQQNTCTEAHLGRDTSQWLGGLCLHYFLDFKCVISVTARPQAKIQIIIKLKIEILHYTLVYRGWFQSSLPQATSAWVQVTLVQFIDTKTRRWLASGKTPVLCVGLMSSNRLHSNTSSRISASANPTEAVTRGQVRFGPFTQESINIFAKESSRSDWGSNPRPTATPPSTKYQR
jgi:hypothetical protein